MKLGIFGGTFDPIHMGHVLITEIVRETLQLERVLFVPAADPPHKQNQKKTPAHHRKKMVKLAIADNPNFDLSEIDLNRPGPHYSVDTVALIRKQYALPAENCFFIIGGDSLDDLPTWHNPRKLITLCRLAVVHRPGYRPNVTSLEHDIPNLSKQIDWIPMESAIDLSSSVIRTRVATSRSIRYQVPEPVRNYIAQHRLYLEL